MELQAPPPFREELLGLRCFGLLNFAFAVFFYKLLDSARGIDEFLLAGEERMALRTNLHPDDRLGRTGFGGCPACAGNRAFDILGMNLVLHDSNIVPRVAMWPPYPAFSPIFIMENPFDRPQERTRAGARAVARLAHRSGLSPYGYFPSLPSFHSSLRPPQGRTRGPQGGRPPRVTGRARLALPFPNRTCPKINTVKNTARSSGKDSGRNRQS